MQVKSLTNLFLLVFAAGAVWLLFSQTNVPNIGLKESFDEGVRNVKRIIQEKPLETEMSEAEKERLSKKLAGGRGVARLFCGSAHFPFIPGANWSYRTSDGDVVKIGIPGQEDQKRFLDGRLMSREKWTNRTIAVCQGGRIRLTDFNFLLIFERDRTVTTPCSEGQYGFSLPADDFLARDNAWSEKGCLVHTVLDENYQEKQSETREDLEVRGRVLGRENVAVPAGNFEAVKVELNLSGRQEVSGGAKRIDSTVDVWAAPGVGIVKASYVDKDGGRPPVIQELAGFQIPTEGNSKTKN